MAKLNEKRMIVIGLYTLLIYILFLIEPTLKSVLNKEWIIDYLTLFIIAFILHLFNENQKNWFRLDILFIVGFIIVHFQWSFMLAVHDIEPIRFEEQYYNSLYYMNYATWLSALSLVFWFLGSAMLSKTKEQVVEYIIDYKVLMYMTTFLFLAFLGTVDSGFFTGSVYKGEGGSAAGSGISGYIQLLFTISLTLLSTLVLLDRRNLKEKSIFILLINLNKLFLLIIISYVLIFLIAGDRGGPMQVAMVLFILIGTFIRPIRFLEFFILLIIGAIILNIVGIGRANSSSENIIVAGVQDMGTSSNYELTESLANSVRTLYMSLDYVKEDKNLLLGQLWIGPILGAVPFAQSYYLSISGMKEYEISSPNYLTYMRFGENATSGEGTTIIADIYLNFGEKGTFIVMFLLGVFFKKLQNELNSQKNLYWIIIAISLGGVAFYMGRGMLFSSYRTILWSMVLMLLLVKFQKKEVK